MKKTILIMVVAGYLLPAARMPVFSDTRTLLSLGAHCDGVTDDSAIIQKTISQAGTVVFPDGKTCVATNLRPASNTTLLCNQNCTLKKLPSDSENYLISTYQTSNVVVRGLTLDLNGAAIHKSPNAIVYSRDDRGIQYTGCRFINSGASSPDIGGISLFRSGGQIGPDNFFDASVNGWHIRIDLGKSMDRLVIQKNEFHGSQWGNIFYTNQGKDNESPANGEIAGNVMASPRDGQWGTGQFGNCIAIYQVDGIDVHDNQCTDPSYSGIRLNHSAHIHVHNNTVDGSHETSVYAEFGAEDNEFDHNIITNGNTGINLTNVKDRPHQGKNIAHDNEIRNMAHFGLMIEHDEAYDNTIENTPYGVWVGYGGDGGDNVLKNNTIRGLPSSPVGPMIHGVAISKAQMSGHNNVIDGNTITGTLYAPIAPVTFSMWPATGYVSNASHAEMWVAHHYPPVGSTLIISGVRGMTEINGKPVKVTAWNDSISSITVDDGGANYTSNPDILFDDKCQTPPTATTVVAVGHLVDVTLVSPGSGCRDVPKAKVSGGGGHAARVHVFGSIITDLDTSTFSAFAPIPQGRPLSIIEILKTHG